LTMKNDKEGSEASRTRAKRVLVKVPVESITDVHGIVEACDYLAVVRTLEPDAGIVEMVGTPDTYDEMMRIARVLERKLNAEILHPRER